MGNHDESEGIEQAISKVVAQAWFDADLHQRLRADPMQALQEAGVALAGAMVVVVAIANPGMAETATLVQRSDRDPFVYEVALAEKPLHLEDESALSWPA